MRTGPTLKVIVHDVAQAIAALHAATQARVPVLLMSAPGAAAYAGPSWFGALVVQAGAAVPDATADSLLDCGDRPGDALAAIRAGVPAIAINLADPARARVVDIATQAAVRIVPYDPDDALDLALHADAASACAAWLGRDRSQIQ